MSFTVYKLNHLGEEELHYSGEIVQHGEDFVCIRAKFGFKTRDYGYVMLKQGDIFTEWFYSKRWYNVFKVEDVDTGELKGYYCNLTRPAKISEDAVRADDLALDVFVRPDGSHLMLDEDEYADLPLTENEREAVQAAVAEIKQLVKDRKSPFHELE